MFIHKLNIPKFLLLAKTSMDTINIYLSIYHVSVDGIIDEQANVK